jgi:preprotein translocase subunit SecA
LNELVQKPLVIVLLMKLILIDEARTPLILSTLKGEGNINKLYLKPLPNS